MGIEFPETRCELGPKHAHYFTQMTSSIWRCKYCWVSMWLPNTLEEAIRFSNDIRKMGIDKAYQKYLQDKPMIRQKLKKLEEIRLLRKVLPEEDLMIAIAAIITKKEEGSNGVKVS